MMKKVRKIHFWIGIVAMVFLLIQSVTGLILYFSTDEPQPNNMQQISEPASQDTGTTDESAAANENAHKRNLKLYKGKGMEWKAEVPMACNALRVCLKSRTQP